MDSLCAIKGDNSIKCTGNFLSGIRTPSPTVYAKDIDLFDEILCAIKMDDSVQCWDNNRSYPSQTAANPPSTLYAKSVVNRCAIKMDDSVECWTGGYILTPSPTVYAKKLISNGSSVCAIQMDDTVRCWGGEYPALAGGVAPSPAIKVFDISTWLNSSAYCAIKQPFPAIGALQCWGGSPLREPVANAKLVVHNAYAICAIDAADSTVACSGIGFNRGENAPNPPIQAKSLYAGTTFMCAIKTDNTVQCWGLAAGVFDSAVKAGAFAQGSNEAVCVITLTDYVVCSGVASHGGTTPNPAIQAKALFASRWNGDASSGSRGAMCAIKSGTNAVQCWGTAAAGGSTPSPTVYAKSIESTSLAMCAIQTDNKVKCWGNASWGGTTPSPAITVKSLFTGSNTQGFCAIKDDDRVQCWGASGSAFTSAPNIKAKSIAVSGGAICVIQLDDTVQCWGISSFGGTTPSPTITAKGVYATYYAMCAIQLDDTVQCWGQPGYGGTTPSPVIKASLIVPESEHSYISVETRMCAIKKQ